MLEEIVRSTMSRAGVVRVRSALNPFLWGFVWSLIFGALTYLMRDDAGAKYGCLLLAALPELVAMAVGVWFAIKNPDRLQSEEFVLRQQALTTLYRRGATPEKLNAAAQIAKMERDTKSRSKGGRDE